MVSLQYTQPKSKQTKPQLIITLKMITESSLKCPSCRLFFGFENTPKILKSCHHTICINCLKTTKHCPIDGKDVNVNKWGLKSFLTDTRILEQIQSQAHHAGSKREDVRFSFASKNKSEQNKLFETNHGSKESISNFHLCKAHMKKADFICKDNSKIACNLCITSLQNENHEFISYEELLRQLTQLTDETYKIYQALNAKSQQMTKRNIEVFIEQELISKKERQAYEIRSFFQRLIEQIRKQQKRVLQRLDELAKNSISSMKSRVDVNSFRNRKQAWAESVHTLISVMEGVYQWSGFEKAFEYLQDQGRRTVLVDQGQRLMEEVGQVNDSVNDMVKENCEQLECEFDNKFINGLESICRFGAKHSDVERQQADQSHRQQKQQPNLKIHHSYSQTISLSIPKLQPLSLPVFSPKLQPLSVPAVKQQFFQLEREHSPSNSASRLSESSQQDFLLDTQKSQLQQNQTLTKNQITFEQNLSLLQNSPYPTKQQFTPILRKQQDSLSVLEMESTIININNRKNHQNSPLLFTKSDDITIQFKPAKKNVTTSCQQIANATAELSKTFLHSTARKKDRSPLKSLNSNMTHSQKKKIDIPEKYLSIWQSAMLDRCETVDFTGAQLGDDKILELTNYLGKSQKIKSVKLIRNKLTDEILPELIDKVAKTNISSLNLSQNLLTEKTLDSLQNMDLGNLKSITVSLNKIVLRKVKDRIEKFKERGVTLTV